MDSVAYTIDAGRMFGILLYFENNLLLDLTTVLLLLFLGVLQLASSVSFFLQLVGKLGEPWGAGNRN